MNDLQVLIADLTVEQFCRMFGICTGCMLLIHISTSILFLWIYYNFFKGDKNAER